MPIDEGDTDEVLVTEAPPYPPCWRCGLGHHSPADIYRCVACGLALCKGEVYVNGQATPLVHRPPKAGRRKGESQVGTCGPVQYLGEAVERGR